MQLEFCGLNEYRVSIAGRAEAVAVRRVALSPDGEHISAEVDGQLMRAPLLVHGAAREQAVTLWLGGSSHEFRCGAARRAARC